MLSQNTPSPSKQPDFTAFPRSSTEPSPIPPDLDHLWQGYKQLAMQIDLLQAQLRKAENSRLESPHHL